MQGVYAWGEPCLSACCCCVYLEVGWSYGGMHLAEVLQMTPSPAPRGYLNTSASCCMTCCMLLAAVGATRGLGCRSVYHDSCANPELCMLWPQSIVTVATSRMHNSMQLKLADVSSVVGAAGLYRASPSLHLL
jgi:hypothetical protein